MVCSRGGLAVALCLVRFVRGLNVWSLSLNSVLLRVVAVWLLITVVAVGVIFVRFMLLMSENLEYVSWCPLLVKFVACNGECTSCSVDYLRSRCSVAGGC